MSQINKYSVREITEDLASNLTVKDQALVSDYTLENIPFLLGKYQLDAVFYTLDGIFLETKPDIQSYSVLGTNQGNSAVNISVNPVQDALDNGYLGDIQIGYQVTNNLFSPSHSLDLKSELYVQEISVDRTEIRAASLSIPEENLQLFAQDLQQRLSAGPYFTGATLSFLDEKVNAWCINVMTEVLEDRLVVTFKLYNPLPSSIDLKSRFVALEQIGGVRKFEVIRTVEVLEDDDQVFLLKGPNFNVSTGNSSVGVVTDYLNYKELFSYPRKNNALELYSIQKGAGIELGIDYSNFANFIHFSSAAERLENFRYKLGLIQEYERELDIVDQDLERLRISNALQGILDNFDPYDRYLYFENTETAWPKVSSDRPYKNVLVEEATEWFENMLTKAQDYDEHNSDGLINTVPQAIRSNPQNEPYLIFVDMIGHHFDDEWLYAKAVSARFSGDNRLDVGIPKDLVQDALRSFGIEIQTTNQNLERFFDLCIPGEYYHKGTELSVKYFERATADNAISGGTVLPISGTMYDGEYSTRTGGLTGLTIDGEYAPRFGVPGTIVDAGSSGRVEDVTKFQPVYIENYRKEIYKRIYHNVPLLLKTKGTARGIRALINCFGIPDSILDIEVQGGVGVDRNVFFGPEESTFLSIDRTRVDNTGSEASLFFDQTVGQFISGTTLSNSRTIQQPAVKYQKGTNNVSIGFDLNKQVNSQIKEYLVASGNFDYDNIIGDPRNTEENYGEAFSLLRTQILPELWDTQGKLQIRTPYAVLRLVRYIDSTLFRTLSTFMSARDEVSVGAIVSDNILHRNRYKGITPGAVDVPELTENIQTVFIDGGEGGSLKVLRGGRPYNRPVLSQSFEIRATTARTVTESRELPTVNYTKENAVSTGRTYQQIVVFDDSPKYNGELLGTNFEVTNGELNEGNRFKQGGSSIEQLPYRVDFRFLCLPAVPTDTVIQAFGSFLGNQFQVTVEGEVERQVSVNNLQLSDPRIVIASSSDTVVFSIECDRPKQQGWLFSESPIEQPFNNYIGLDILPDPEFGQNLDTEIGRIINQKVIVLPESGNSTQMVGSFVNPELESAGLFWEQAVGAKNFRHIYARYVPLNRPAPLKIFDLSLRGERSWPDLNEGPYLLENVADCYILSTEEGERQRLNDLNILYGNHKLYKIYAVVGSEENNLAVLDLETGEFREWDDSEDTKLWAALRGYSNDWDAKSYVMSRYVQGVSSQTSIFGIVLGDDVTGTDVTGTGVSDPRVLIEPYMGTSYVFVKALDDSPVFQLRIKEWLTNNSL